MFKKDTTSKYKLPIVRKVLIIVCLLYALGFTSFLVLFYGPFDGFKNFWITSAMTTMRHQYLATSLYSEEYIEKVLESANEFSKFKTLEIATQKSIIRHSALAFDVERSSPTSNETKWINHKVVTLLKPSKN